jgi:hypothetical protein
MWLCFTLICFLLWCFMAARRSSSQCESLCKTLALPVDACQVRVCWFNPLFVNWECCHKFPSLQRLHIHTHTQSKGHFNSHKIWATRVKENNEKKRKTKKWATLDPSLHFGSPNHEISFKLFLKIWIHPSKLMSYRLNHNLICLGPGPSSICLKINSKLLTNRNAWFHWTLLLGPLSKVALK